MAALAQLWALLTDEKVLDDEKSILSSCDSVLSEDSVLELALDDPECFAALELCFLAGVLFKLDCALLWELALGSASMELCID